MSSAPMPRRWYPGSTAPEATSRVPPLWTLTCQIPTMRPPLFGHQEPGPVQTARDEPRRARHRLDRGPVGLHRRPDPDLPEHQRSSIRSTHRALHPGASNGSAK